VGKEKRQFPRFEVDWPVTMLTTQGPIEGEVVNVSLGGAFILCQKEPKANEVFRLVIKIPHHRQILRATARIARSRIYGPDNEDSLSGIGVRFVEIADDDLQYIRELVAGQQG
jgi:c-di-GMP-binding flagellar brake protein YcgR